MSMTHCSECLGLGCESCDFEGSFALDQDSVNWDKDAMHSLRNQMANGLQPWQKKEKRTALRSKKFSKKDMDAMTQHKKGKK